MHFTSCEYFTFVNLILALCSVETLVYEFQHCLHYGDSEMNNC